MSTKPLIKPLKWWQKPPKDKLPDVLAYAIALIVLIVIAFGVPKVFGWV